MFKKHALQVSVVKPSADKQDGNETMQFAAVNELIEKISKIDIKRVAIGCVAVYASVVAINTASEIAINAAPKN